MNEKILEIGGPPELRAVTSWRVDPQYPTMPDALLTISLPGTMAWPDLAILADWLLAEHSAQPGVIFDESLLLGRARFIAGATEIVLEVTGASYELAKGWPMASFIERVHRLYPDHRSAVFEPESVPFRLFASATTAFGDHTCQLTLDFEYAEETIAVPMIHQWIKDQTGIEEAAVKRMLKQACAQAKTFFEQSAPIMPTVRRPPTF